MTSDLKKRIIRSSLAIFGGDGVSQALRLLGNLILTRLLVPEFFGLMAIANVVIMAIGLFSDIGTGPGVIRSKRGLDPTFLNTAWTMQVIRGFFLWFLILLATYPVFSFYKEPALLWILPILGVSNIIVGFNSMAIIVYNKKLKMDKLVVMEIFTQIIGLMCMMLLAYIFRNIWALVCGTLLSNLVKMIWSHQLPLKLKHSFNLEKAALSELFHYGKWIFLSTAMMFLATQADRLILGKIFPLALLGVYSIAAGFSGLPRDIVNKLSNHIIFPVISMYSSMPREELRKKILQKRKYLLYPLAVAVAVFGCFGDYLIILLYDNRYHEAGWMLPMLALGMWPLLLYASIDRCLYVVDNPKFPALANCSKFIFMAVCLPAAYHLGGKFWAILVIALNDISVYLIINYGLKKKGLSGLRQDIIATAFLVGILFILLCARHYMNLGITGKSVFT